jgi:proline iminopeptidase
MLFPEIEPHEQGTLRLDSLHTMYWEVAGNPRGTPVVFLHGGPGSGTVPNHRRFFDPQTYRIVLFDQRGAGRSTPLGELRDNTTAHLVDDIETLRAHLHIERWWLFGGSWGSTLALAYAQRHPMRCLGLILRGVFLARPTEIEWFLSGMRAVFPEAWERFASHLPDAERGDLLAGYYRRLVDPDPQVHMPAAIAWSTYEGACSTLLPSPATVSHFGEAHVALGLARIEAHYFRHGAFLAPNELLANMHRLRGMPGAIVQGRYDVVCPPVTAYELHRAWPTATLQIVDDAGHSAWEPGTTRALIAATERCKRRAGLTG